jgi:transcriptional regulator
MYQPPSFREDRLDVQHGLMRAHPLGLIITAGGAGLMANSIPCLVDADGTPLGTIRCHLARANSQWRELADVEECLVVFQGPQDYVTPSWYAGKRETGKVVPTWNYATVHAWGRPRVIDDDVWLRRQLDDLTRQCESDLPSPWKVDDAPADFIIAQMKGIVGVEISIGRIEGKWKMSQNRSEADRAGVLDGYRAKGPTAAGMAKLVAERGGLASD